MHFLNGNVLSSIKFSLKYVPKGPINNVPALVQIMAWRRPGDKPLSEPMMISLLTHICVTRPQWVNSNGNMCEYNRSSTYIHRNVRRLTIKSRKFSKPLDWVLEIVSLCTVKYIQTPFLPRRLSISKRSDIIKLKYQGFTIVRDFSKRRKYGCVKFQGNQIHLNGSVRDSWFRELF